MITDTNPEEKSCFPKTISPDQAKDTGMALVLLALMLGYFFHLPYCYPFAMLLLLINMIRPNVYRPAARVWFGLARILNAVFSRVLLTLVFLLLVVPIGTIRRWLGADPLQLKAWKKDSASVFKVRDQTFQARDIEKPY